MDASEDLKQKGQQAFESNNFETAAACFEQLVGQQPAEVHSHLFLGLSYLLMGQEEAAQLAWALAFQEVDDRDQSSLLQELAGLIQNKIADFEQQENWEVAFLLYQYLNEVTPPDVNTILKNIQAGIRGEQLDSNILINLRLLDTLSLADKQSTPLDNTLLENTLAAIIDWDTGNLETLAWIENVANHLQNPAKISELLSKKVTKFREEGAYIEDLDLALDYVEAGLRLDHNNFALKDEQILLYIKKKDFNKVAFLANQLLHECHTKKAKIHIKGILVENLLHIPGRWQEAKEELESLLTLADEFIQEYEENSSSYAISTSSLLRSLSFYQYIQDNPEDCRARQNQLSNFYLKLVQNQKPGLNLVDQSSRLFHQKHSEVRPERLKIGFLSEFMTRHSVGWLSRWIFQHYDNSRFDFYAYFHRRDSSSGELSFFSETWFSKPATKAFSVHGHPQEVARKIYEDGIDILVDLDSITSDKSYAVLALKPAPIQVTWLGYDATGLPTIDYFLVDSLVVPDDADNYYSETLWRMPQTYLAVNGFEVGIPTLRREDLNIPPDAIVYLSAQTAVKRHPETIFCQLQILKQVPNSYLLLKGLGDSDALRSATLQTATEEGISGDRFRFLEFDSDEPTHRANLSVADVILDTFPYTGATTTLETLWMGIPLVTRVGRQFASRNSYAMLRHVGVEAGIAHSAEEYIEWGVRFGTDAALREQVKEQLWRSRHNSPLWNAEQFTRDLENAFEQMWQKYQEENSL